MAHPEYPASLEVGTVGDGTLTISLAGEWRLGGDLPGPEAVADHLGEQPGLSRLGYETSGLADWDTGLMVLLVNIRRLAESGGIEIDESGLPEGARNLLDLAFAVPERADTRRHDTRRTFVVEVGEATRDLVNSIVELVSFIGEATQSVWRWVRGRAEFLRSDLMQYIQEAGTNALPIVSLVTFLIGMIFAFVGVMQLRGFGAGIYTADLVAVGMVREMAPIMTAIIIAGRTGAAYAAQLGTMKVNEEIDALTTLGINPIDFLVLPRLIALIVMMPLLTMYASLMGILGGMAVSMAMLDLSFLQYGVQTVNAVDLSSLFTGLLKCVVYGSLVAIAGCQQGINCGGSAMAVGQATTRAVVNSIVLIVVSACALTVIYVNLGI